MWEANTNDNPQSSSTNNQQVLKCKIKPQSKKEEKDTRVDDKTRQDLVTHSGQQ